MAKTLAELSRVYIPVKGTVMDEVPLKELDRLVDSPVLGPQIRQDIRAYLKEPTIAAELERELDNK